MKDYYNYDLECFERTTDEEPRQLQNNPSVHFVVGKRSELVRTYLGCRELINETRENGLPRKNRQALTEVEMRFQSMKKYIKKINVHRHGFWQRELGERIKSGPKQIVIGLREKSLILADRLERDVVFETVTNRQTNEENYF